MKIKDMFKKFIYSKNRELDARFHEELVAMLALKYYKKFETNLQAAQLDALYENSASLPSSVEDETEKVLAMMVKMAANTPEEFTKKLSKGLFHAVCDAIQIAFATGYSIKDPKEYLRWILKVNAHAVSAAKKLTEEQKDQSWTEWLRLYYVTHNYKKSRQLIADRLATDAGRLVTDGVLYKKRTHKDCFKQSDISLLLWVDQDHKDRKDEEIDILDIYMSKTQVDHVRSVRDGGTTTYENAELMMATDNLSKGAKSNPPAFSHQDQSGFAFPQDTKVDDLEKLVDTITGVGYNKNS